MVLIAAMLRDFDTDNVEVGSNQSSKIGGQVEGAGDYVTHCEKNHNVGRADYISIFSSGFDGETCSCEVTSSVVCCYES